MSSKSPPKPSGNFANSSNKVVKPTHVTQLFSLVSKQPSMGNNLDKHGDGAFPYITITPTDKRSKPFLLKLLHASHCKSYMAPIDIDKIPTIVLRERSSTFRFIDSIDPSVFKKLKPDSFVGMHEMILAFYPTSEFYSPYSVMYFRIVDGRYPQDSMGGARVLRTLKSNDNISLKVYFSLPNMVHKDEFHHLSLEVINENCAFNEGIAYGAMAVQFRFSNAKLPFAESLVKVCAVLDIDQTVLQGFKESPTFLDVTVHDENIGTLEGMLRQGKLVDQTKPEGEQKLPEFDGSVAGGSVRGLFDVDGDNQSTIDELRKAHMNKERLENLTRQEKKQQRLIDNENNNHQTALSKAVERGGSPVPPRSKVVGKIAQWMSGPAKTSNVSGSIIENAPRDDIFESTETIKIDKGKGKARQENETSKAVTEVSKNEKKIVENAIIPQIHDPIKQISSIISNINEPKNIYDGQDEGDKSDNIVDISDESPQQFFDGGSVFDVHDSASLIDVKQVGSLRSLLSNISGICEENGRGPIQTSASGNVPYSYYEDIKSRFSEIGNIMVYVSQNDGRWCVSFNEDDGGERISIIRLFSEIPYAVRTFSGY